MPRHLDRVSVIRSWAVPDFCLGFAPVSAGFGASGPRQLSQTFYGLTQKIACAEGLPL